MSGVNIYGVTGIGAVNIYYGNSDAGGQLTQCDTNDICLTRDLLVQFFNAIDAAQDVVEQLFPATTATSSFVTKISAFAFMNDYTYVRFIWISRNPGVLFDTRNLHQCYQLLEIYYEFHLDSWRNDPTVNTLTQKV